jgi:hypothetical protein
MDEDNRDSGVDEERGCCESEFDEVAQGDDDTKFTASLHIALLANGMAMLHALLVLTCCMRRSAEGRLSHHGEPGLLVNCVASGGSVWILPA